MMPLAMGAYDHPRPPTPMRRKSITVHSNGKGIYKRKMHRKENSDTALKRMCIEQTSIGGERTTSTFKNSAAIGL